MRIGKLTNKRIKANNYKNIMSVSSCVPKEEEIKVGINKFTNNCEGFQGILKQVK